MAQLMPLPLTVSCFSKIQIGFTFLVPAHLGSPGKRAVKRVCACVSKLTDIQTQWIQYFKPLDANVISGLALLFLHPPLNSWRKACCSFYDALNDVALIIKNTQTSVCQRLPDVISHESTYDTTSKHYVLKDHWRSNVRIIKSFTYIRNKKFIPLYTHLMHLSKVSLTNFGFGISGSMVTQSFQSSQLHLNWKLLRWYENQLEKLYN